MRNGPYRLLSLLVLFTFAGRAETFKNPQVILTSSTPSTVTQGDVNGDGKPDLIYADVSGFTATIHVLLNQGNNAFLAGQNIVGLTPKPFVAVTVADVNNDGKADLVLAFSDTQSPALAVALGNGDGTFQPLLVSPLPSYPTSSSNYAVIHALVVADVNGDGKQDVIFSDGGNAVAWVCLGDNTGHFIQQTQLNDQNPAYAIYLGDFNRDGKIDILLNEHLAARAAVYLNTGNTGFALSGYVNGPQGIAGMAVKDMDGDGYPDIVINGQDNVLRILHGNPDATFTATLSMPVPVAASVMSPDVIDVDDFNHDGILDLALETADGVHILIGQGNFLFTPLQPAPVASYPGLAAIGDLNQDTHTDFAFPVPGGIAILYGQQDGSLHSADSYDFRYNVRGAALADFNGDGRKDAIVSVFALHPRVMTGNADGSFTLLPDSNTPSPTAHDQGSITTGDFNGDGHADFISSIGSSDLNEAQGVVYALGQGNGTFGALNFVSGYNQITDLGSAVGDLNHDGRTDISASAYGGAQQAFFLGQPDGSFRQTTLLTNPLSSVAPWVYGDFNKDGSIDAAIVDGGAVQIETGKGDGTFAPGFLYNAGTSSALGSPLSSIAIDIDGDGNLDILSPIQFTVQVFYGHGDGTFAPPVYLPLAQPPNSLVQPAAFYDGINAADFNGDGILDLVLTNGDLVTILHGMGNRQFTASENYLAGAGTAAPLVADFNGDGRPDILVANLDLDSASTVTVLLNIPDAGDVSTKLTVSPEPSTFPQPFSINLSLTAAVASSGTPTGPVSFTLDGVSLGSVTLSNGNASFLVNTQVPVGRHTISALYSGDSIFHAATFTVQHTVVPVAVATQTILTATPNPSSYGLPVTLTAVVISAAAVQGGSITFMDGATVLGTSPLHQSGPVTFSPPTLQFGSHALTATYSGATGLQSSTSNTVQLLVQPDATQTTLISTSNPALVGTNVTFTATVTNTIAPALAPPAGNVTFYDGTTVLGVAAMNGDGVAAYSTNALPVGTHIITASYAGTSNTLPSVSPAIQQAIVAIQGDFTLDVTPGSATIYTGVAARSQVIVSAVNGFNQTVSLTCSGLPAAATCLFKPASVPGGNGQVEFTIQTSPPHPITTADSAPPLPWKPMAATSTVLSLALLLLPRRLRSLKLPLLMLMGLLLTTAMSACGGPGPAGGGTPAGTYTISINGAALPLTHSTTVHLTVKSFF